VSKLVIIYLLSVLSQRRWSRHLGDTAFQLYGTSYLFVNYLDLLLFSRSADVVDMSLTSLQKRSFYQQWRCFAVLLCSENTSGGADGTFLNT
jgi:hypothetical protein